jgi:hypothetical protein
MPASTVCPQHAGPFLWTSPYLIVDHQARASRRCSRVACGTAAPRWSPPIPSIGVPLGIALPRLHRLLQRKHRPLIVGAEVGETVHAFSIRTGRRSRHAACPFMSFSTGKPARQAECSSSTKSIPLMWYLSAKIAVVQAPHPTARTFSGSGSWLWLPQESPAPSAMGSALGSKLRPVARRLEGKSLKGSSSSRAGRGQQCRPTGRSRRTNASVGRPSRSRPGRHHRYRAKSNPLLAEQPGFSEFALLGSRILLSGKLGFGTPVSA